MMSELENVMTCGTCGFQYPDNTPAGRCPREYDHPETGVMEYNGLPVVLVRVTATVSFDAYMVADSEPGVPQTAERVGMDISDAVEYHAGRLGDTEDGDALVAVTTDVKVTMHQFDVVPCEDTSENVESTVIGMSADR